MTIQSSKMQFLLKSTEKIILEALKISITINYYGQENKTQKL